MIGLVKGIWASRRNHVIRIEYLQEKLGNKFFRMNLGWAITLVTGLLKVIRKELLSDLFVEYPALIDECKKLIKLDEKVKNK